MGKYCAVENCGKSEKEAKGLYKFPSDSTRKQMWINATKNRRTTANN